MGLNAYGISGYNGLSRLHGIGRGRSGLDPDRRQGSHATRIKAGKSMLQRRFMKRTTTAGDRDRIATLENSKFLNPMREEILLAAWIRVSVLEQHPHVGFANYGFGCQGSGEVSESNAIH